jgi:hypothetical protein
MANNVVQLVHTYGEIGMRRVFCLLLLFVAVPASAAGDRRDGNWWLLQSEGIKATYIVGFFDGMILGHRISYTVAGSDGKPLLSETTQKLVHSSFAVVHEKYFVNVTNGQIAGGLTEFYKDFRNRKIKIGDAVPVITSQIAGSPAKMIDEFIERLRSDAQ